MALSAAGHGDLDRVEVEYLRQPGGGTLLLEQDGAAPMAVHTDGPPEAAVWAVAPQSADSMAFTLRSFGDGPVDVLAWNARRRMPGVTYSNLGTIGATIALLDRWDDRIIKQELKHLSPALIVVAFGTNEGFHNSTGPETYEIRFADRLHAIRAAAPGAALLVVGPPDGARRRGRGGEQAGDCGDPNWGTPPRLASVRAAQRQAAEREGAFFWDWQAAMGGGCSMLRWAEANPPLAAPDHVHLLSPGYRQSADTLFGTIMDGYRRYRALRGSTERPVS